MNCYQHAALLIIRCKDNDGNPLGCIIILSAEGVTQGDPLAMFVYGISMVPLAEFLRAEVPSLIQTWYADDCSMGGRVSGIATAMKLLLEKGPQRGYFPEPAMSIFIGQREDTPRAKAVLAEFNFAH